jgi:hypothetical protein
MDFLHSLRNYPNNPVCVNWHGKSRDVECFRYRIYRHTNIPTYLDGYAYKNAGMIRNNE